MAAKQLGTSWADGVKLPNYRKNVVSGVGATYTLSASESGSLCLFDRAAGVVYTLPSPEVGLVFEFSVTTTISSNAAKIITSGATVLMTGTVMSGNATIAASGDVFTANGSTHVAISMNGTDTGGIIGGRIRLECLSSTLWLISGDIVGSGTNADPFATS